MKETLDYRRINFDKLGDVYYPFSPIKESLVARAKIKYRYFTTRNPSRHYLDHLFIWRRTERGENFWEALYSGRKTVPEEELVRLVKEELIHKGVYKEESVVYEKYKELFV